MAPHTVCGCQPNALTISSMLAPFAVLSIAISCACLLSARVRLSAIAGAMLIAVAAASPARAGIELAIGDFLHRVEQAVSSLAGKTGAGAQAACLDLVRSLLDLDTVARQAAGETWSRMTKAQRAKFVAAVGRRAARECVVQNRNSSGAPVAFVGLRSATGGDRLLATRVDQKNGAHRTVVWRLKAGAAPLQAIDLLVDGRSTALTLRDEVKAILDRTNGDIDALITTLGR
jgi:ABC-type transporter MlaC component